MDRIKQSIVMAAGDLLAIDNRVATHGRPSYRPNYGQAKRWCRRVNVLVNFRESLGYRSAPGSRRI
jgi:L-asparagine oxygenase